MNHLFCNYYSRYVLLHPLKFICIKFPASVTIDSVSEGVTKTVRI